MADSDHESTQSPELIGSNDDLLTQILRRLPVSSIHRFKSVSKHWLTLLSPSHFTLFFDNVSISPGPGLFIRDLYIPYDPENRTTSTFPSLKTYSGLNSIRIVQSCNGLLLLSSDRGYQRGNGRDYYVFNTTTKRFTIIPSVSGGQNVHKTIRFMGLAFDQKDFHFKILCIHRKKPDSEMFQIQIFSSKTGKWNISNEFLCEDYYTPFSSGVYWNGAIHWAPSCVRPSYFNLNDEKLQKMPLPSPMPVRMGFFRVYKDGARPLYFGESRGHLHLVETAHQESGLFLNVYEILSDHSGWFVKYQVGFDDLRTIFPEMIHFYQDPSIPYYYELDVLDVVRGEEDQDTFMVLRILKKIIKYSVLNKGFKYIFDLSNTSCGSIGPWEVQCYVIPKP